jgi:hypothetical protein
MQLVPAHVRNFAAVDLSGVEADDAAFENIEPLHSAKFDAFRKQNLHTNTNA